MVISKSLSRFSRNTLDTLNILRQLKGTRRGRLLRTREHTQHIGGWRVDAHHPLFIMRDERESRSASENVKWRLRKKYEQGEITGWCQLYGYTINHGIVEIDNLKAVIIRRIFSEYLAGESATGDCETPAKRRGALRTGRPVEAIYRFGDIEK